MYKLKEWFCWFFLTGVYIWGWCSIIACIFAPLILGVSVSTWWFLAWVITLPAAIATIMVMDMRKGNK